MFTLLMKLYQANASEYKEVTCMLEHLSYSEMYATCPIGPF